MVTYEALEDEIVARLSTLAPAVEVEALPDTPSKFNKAFSKPRVTVAYRSSEFSREAVRGFPEQFATGIAIQDEFASVEVVIQSRTIRGAAGCHGVKAAVVQRLFSFKPTHWSFMTLESYKFMDQDKEAGLFTYAATFIVKTTIVPLPDNDNETNLNQVTLNVEING